MNPTTLHAFSIETGEEVKPGDPLTNFRGDSAGTLVSIDRCDADGMGKVTASESYGRNANAFGLRITEENNE